ncbi:riboflavin synthase, alpha subunit [Cladophialophora yegresii CBS 114405]|uniref:Riboflavin synthase n=1 Tax=Cladophialophora yegresii CBS 114405 TaxID=1182544 RepID=W9WFW2_9EURO|nr:riboflavin synthase, alpha subunit [Cladophialophora yegresii CBS 114405]EXJ57409.1 riboflavin synthase, alpha subunit [Cladophialophora yegresii CBS 114405]
MFTGLVETIGTVSSLVPLDPSTSGGNGTSLTISDCSSILTDAALGDSISVNGTCLTVTELDSSRHRFKVGVAPETLRRTNLGGLKEGSRVNLERAVLGSTRMGGHFVQGHVDTIATIVSVTPDGNALTFRLQPREREPLRYIVEKGYITLDGASLTITRVNDEEGWFEVMLISYTQERVVMAGKTAGEGVNVEIDIVGKLVEKSVVGYFEREAQAEGGRGPAILEKIVGRLVEAKVGAMQQQQR